MIRKYLIFGFISLFLIGCEGMGGTVDSGSQSFVDTSEDSYVDEGQTHVDVEPGRHVSCPDTELFDFNQKVEDQQQANSLFMEFFSQEKGYPQFNASKVWYVESMNEYVYWDMYGINEQQVGGVLYENGKLVRKGYCK
ncbi:hypothetical protein ACFL96_08430 [Thermoproteota archaeon]